MSMKKLAIMLAMLVALLPMAQAGKTEDKVVDALLKVGVKALQMEQDRRAKKAEEEAALSSPAAEEPAAEAPDAEEAAADGAPAEKRSWKDRGRDMVSAFVSGGVGKLESESFSKVLAGAVKDAFDVLVKEYKEQYKEEGREYAREVGDMVVSRVLQDPKIERSIFTIQVLCWAVIVYLTLVTVFVVICFHHIRRANARVLTAVEEVKAMLAAEQKN
jgi:hypothetical protein